MKGKSAMVDTPALPVERGRREGRYRDSSLDLLKADSIANILGIYWILIKYFLNKEIYMKAKHCRMI